MQTGSTEYGGMQTKLYLTCIRPLEDEKLFQKLFAAASAERKEKIGRYRFLKDRLLSLGAEGLLLYALRKAGRPRDALSFGYGENGKPYLLQTERFCFNLSHAGEYAMLAVSDAEVGCDIERIRPADPALFRRVLTPEERSAFLSADEAERDALFFRYWVLKESCMKALGKGLLLDPGSIRITLGPKICASGEALLQPLAFSEGEIPGYRYAVCRAGTDIQTQTEIVAMEEITGGIENEH